MSISETLRGKTALITGATGGIGQAVAAILAESGVHLLLHGNAHRETLDELTQKFSLSGIVGDKITVKQITADFSNEKERHFFVQESFNLMGNIDIAVLAAGVDLMTPKMKAKTFTQRLESLMQVDAVGAAETARFFAEKNRLARRNGVVILFGWDGVLHGMEGDTAQLYAMAKGAIHGLVRSLAKSYAPNIRVICVAPGWISTRWGSQAAEKIKENCAAESLSGRWGTPEDVAKFVRFLVSDDAAYLNGEILSLNGGKRIC
ncbi:MAG: SDR family oxidoreductase [Planctomycetaceae bacterium]|jgi:3-oxoacyl-[acyl-carrier protein] reductase|nr:SDR family oxidoreductase [Planctomycetaceae bacterium]